MSTADGGSEREIAGFIDGISTHGVSGWLAYTDGSAYEGRMHFLCAGSRFALPTLQFRDRINETNGLPTQVGFSLELPPVFNAEELQEAVIETEQGQQINVWDGCHPTQLITPKIIHTERWKQLIDPYFLHNYMSMPICNPVSLLIRLLNDVEHRIFDPIYMVDIDSRRAFVRELTENKPIELRLSLNPKISAILQYADRDWLASLDTPTLLSVFRGALVTNIFNIPFVYQDYLQRCGTEDRRRIEEHQKSTGFDRLYCAMVHHLYSVRGHEIMDGFNRFPTLVVEGREQSMSLAATQIEQAQGLIPNGFQRYDLGLKHYIRHGQFEAHRLKALVPPPSLEVMAQAAKLRRLEPEIPDPRELDVRYWGVDRSKKILAGASKIWQAQEAAKAVLPIFMPWFSYGGADKEGLLLAQAIREEFSDQVEIIFVLSVGGGREGYLYEAGFNALTLHVDEFTEPRHIELVIQRIIAAPNVRCVVNCNSLDFWQFFVKNSEMVASLTAVATMSFCDDRNPETGARDGWLRRFFKYVATQNTILLSDNAKHVADFVADYHLDTLKNTRVMHYPVTPSRRKRSYEINGQPRLLWASRLDEQKGIGTLAAVAQLMPECDFHVFGSHLLFEPDHRVTLLRSLNNVYMQGAYQEFDELKIETFDLFLYTSAWDGLPNILLEVGSAGLPIVSSAVGGIPELLNDENAFLVADHSSASAFMEAIREALVSEEGRMGKAEALYASISENHSWAQFRQAVREIFGEYIG